MAGRANRAPLVEASAKPEPAAYTVGDSPFQESDDLLLQAEKLTPEQVQAIVKRLEAKPKQP
jgi:hypothetical protein